MKDIVIITSNSIRHQYFKLVFSNNKNLNVLKTFVEYENDYKLAIKKPNIEKLDDTPALHFDERHNSEHDFFSDVIELFEDNSNSEFIKKGSINSEKVISDLIRLNPSLIITYGCSIIKSKLIDHFNRRIINVHLGLSPYYFGSGTNYHCLVNNEFQFEGYTFMYMDYGIDTGEIIHQSRALILPFDNPHQIGNRLIKQMTKDFIKLVVNFHLVELMTPIIEIKGRVYKKTDATDEKTRQLYDNFENKSVISFLKKERQIINQYPIIRQSFFEKDD